VWSKSPVTWLQVSCVQLLEQGKYLESGAVENSGNIRKKQTC